MKGARHAAALAALATCWQAVVNLAGRHTSGAIAHGLLLWRAERTLRLPSEAVLAVWTARHHELAQALSAVYLAAHPLAVVALLVAVWRSRRSSYGLVLGSFVATTVVCLLVSLWPVAPPTLLGVGVPAAAAGGSAVAEYHSLGGLADHVAAFPSVHVAWAVYVGYWTRRLQLLAWPRAMAYPALVVAVVVLGGHHTWLDCAAGGLVAWLACRGAVLVDRPDVDTEARVPVPGVPSDLVTERGREVVCARVDRQRAVVGVDRRPPLGAAVARACEREGPAPVALRHVVLLLRCDRLARRFPITANPAGQSSGQASERVDSALPFTRSDDSRRRLTGGTLARTGTPAPPDRLLSASNATVDARPAGPRKRAEDRAPLALDPTPTAAQPSISLSNRRESGSKVDPVAAPGGGGRGV